MLDFYPEEQREMRQGRQDGPVGGGVNVRLGFLSKQQSEMGLKVRFGGRVRAKDRHLRDIRSRLTRVIWALI